MTSPVAEARPLKTDKQESKHQQRVEMCPNRMTVTLAELLLEEKKVFPWQLQDARNYQERKGGTLGKALVRLGFVKDEEITDLLGRQYGLPSIDLCYGPPRSTERRRDLALAEACAKSERTAWQYVTAMHAAALGGARRPIRGMVEDVEDMRVRLTRERDEARARVAELERRLAEVTGAPHSPGRPASAPPQ
jgi:cell division septum initiation protein DivIVA